MNSRWVKLMIALFDKKGLCITILLAGSLTFIGWISVSKIVEVYDSQASIRSIMELEREISQLRGQYQDSHPETLQADLKQVEEHLIQDFTHLAHWAQDLQEKGKPLALRMHYRILKTERPHSAIEGITIIPIEFQIRPRDDQSGYRRFLQFLQTLEHSGPRINIQEVTVKGNGTKATHFTVGLSVWMKTPDTIEL